MKPLRNILDRMHPLFKKGGRYEKFYALYEAGDTFLYTPGEVTPGPSHVRDGIDLKRMMTLVVVALIPCVLMAFYNTGYQANLAIASSDAINVFSSWRGSIYTGLGFSYDPTSFVGNVVHGMLYFLPVYIVTMTVGGMCEAVFSMVRGHEINEGFLVSGLLFPLTLPPTIPLWQVGIGIAFGVVIGKEVFGGTGKNFLNPALTARAFLYFAYPAQISGNFVWTAADGFSGATPLGALAAAPVAEGMKAITDVSFLQAFLGQMQGSMGETSTLACLIGAVILIATGVGSWQIMVACVLGALGMAGVFSVFGSDTNPMFAMPPLWHLVVGGFAFGAVFMATDPVSAAQTAVGKWIYGVLIGIMTVLIRVINPAYPEGIMLAILFGNVMAPLIDYYVVQANIKRRLARNAA
ncbi:MAG: Na(+)-translocating NADH-quinone reductase subunit B [Gemmatimonadota bacterium]|nr:MAG: Na(+)-translocating NADH-quinone reductase subunit B [Gemmatimonadota bacterium]